MWLYVWGFCSAHTPFSTTLRWPQHWIGSSSVSNRMRVESLKSAQKRFGSRFSASELSTLVPSAPLLPLGLFPSPSWGTASVRLTPEMDQSSTFRWGHHWHHCTEPGWVVTARDSNPVQFPGVKLADRLGLLEIKRRKAATPLACGTTSILTSSNCLPHRKPIAHRYLMEQWVLFYL